MASLLGAGERGLRLVPVAAFCEQQSEPQGAETVVTLIGAPVGSLRSTEISAVME